MSWKSIVSAGLLCILASPVFAVATLQIDVQRFTAGPNNGRLMLDSSGNIVWKLTVTPDAGLVGSGKGSVASEIAFTVAGGNLVSALKDATNWDYDNPGTAPASFNDFWNASSDGVETNGNRIMAALGSVNFGTTGAKDFLTITQQGPLYIAAANPSNRLVFTLDAFGAYSGNGLLAMDEGTVNSAVNASVTKTILPGDTNFDGDVNLLDLATIGANYNNLASQTWAGGNFNGTGVGLTNLAILGTFWNATPIAPPGSGGLASLAVPEPASLVLVVLGLAGACLRNRWRS